MAALDLARRARLGRPHGGPRGGAPPRRARHPRGGPRRRPSRRGGDDGRARWGVFAAEGPGSRLVADESTDPTTLGGRKPWCSLAGSLDRALVTAWCGDDTRRLYAVRLGAANGVAVEEGAWVARGLPLVPSGPVSFTASAAHPVGPPGWYLERSGFAWGGMGVAAIWWGGAVGVARRLREQLRQREPDQVGLMHLGAVDATPARGVGRAGARRGVGRRRGGRRRGRCRAGPARAARRRPHRRGGARSGGPRARAGPPRPRGGARRARGRPPALRPAGARRARRGRPRPPRARPLAPEARSRRSSGEHRRLRPSTTPTPAPRSRSGQSDRSGAACLP